MTDKKISQLSNITGAELADNDEFVVARASTSENFAVTKAELYGSLPPASLSYSDLVASTEYTYSTGSAYSVVAGNVIGTTDGGFWEVAASGASDHHATTAGGVKLYEAGPNFSTRARAVAAHDRNVAAGRSVPAGTVWSCPGLTVVVESGATEISDLQGFAYAGGSLTSDLTVNVPTDFPSLQAAFDAMTVMDPNGHEVIINIESGHDLASGVRMDNADLTGFRITSDDATVNLVATGFSTVSSAEWPLGDVREAAFAFYNCQGPIFDTVVDAELNYLDCNGLVCGFGGNMHVTSGSGCNGFRNNFECRSGRIYAGGSDWSTAYEFCARMTSGTFFEMRDAIIADSFNDLTLADDRAGGMLVSRGSHGNGQGIAFSNHPYSGLSIRRSHISLINATFAADVAPRAIQFFDGGIAVVNSSTLVDGSPLTAADTNLPASNGIFQSGMLLNSNDDITVVTSDANGTLIKYNNGQFQMISPDFTVDITTAEGNIYRSSTTTWDFSSLIGADATVTSYTHQNVTNQISWASFRPISASRVQILPLAATSMSAIDYRVIAAGYWTLTGEDG